MKSSIPFCGLLLLLAAPGFPADQELGALTLEQLMNIRVQGAALHPQTLREAPANVTVITAEDIRKYGYRTLGEALASARGFQVNNNRTYHTAGVRGFNLPWDYASRILVMVNGHNMADNLFDSMLWFGVDFPIDMSLMSQIEIIRGPSSALYGSSGIFATINIITKSPDDAGPTRLILDGGSFGEKKAQIVTSASLGPARMLLSGSVFNNRGESPLLFPEFNTADANYGRAVRMDGEKGYHFFSNVVWNNWSLTLALSDRNKVQPVSWGETVFNDRGTRVIENSNYAEAAYNREFTAGQLRWRSYYSQTHLGGRFQYPLDSGDPLRGAVEDNRTFSWGDQVGTHLTWRFDAGRAGTITAGAEAKVDLRAYQGAKDVAPVPLEWVNINRRDAQVGLFAQDELALSRRWKLNLGLRLDTSHYRRNSVSPRVALIYENADGWTYKLLYGRAFRNPSAFDLFYADGLVAVANPRLRPERADTLEINAERKIGTRMSMIAAAYGYRLRDFLVGVYTDGGIGQTQNSGGIEAAGVELELNSRPFAWLEAVGSYGIQKSDYTQGGMLENSPRRLAKLRFALPLGKKMEASSGLQYYSSRKTLAGATVDPAYNWDFTLTSKRLLKNFDVQFGLRNAFNQQRFDPVALNPRVDSMSQPGRTIFVQLIAHAAE